MEDGDCPILISDDEDEEDDDEEVARLFGSTKANAVADGAGNPQLQKSADARSNSSQGSNASSMTHKIRIRLKLRKNDQAAISTEGASSKPATSRQTTGYLDDLDGEDTLEYPHLGDNTNHISVIPESPHQRPHSPFIVLDSLDASKDLHGPQLMNEGETNAGSLQNKHNKSSTSHISILSTSGDLSPPLYSEDEQTIFDIEPNPNTNPGDRQSFTGVERQITESENLPKQTVGLSSVFSSLPKPVVVLEKLKLPSSADPLSYSQKITDNKALDIRKNDIIDCLMDKCMESDSFEMASPLHARKSLFSNKTKASQNSSQATGSESILTGRTLWVTTCVAESDSNESFVNYKTKGRKILDSASDSLHVISGDDFEDTDKQCVRKRKMALGSSSTNRKKRKTTSDTSATSGFMTLASNQKKKVIHRPPRISSDSETDDPSHSPVFGVQQKPSDRLLHTSRSDYQASSLSKTKSNKQIGVDNLKSIAFDDSKNYDGVKKKSLIGNNDLPLYNLDSDTSSSEKDFLDNVHSYKELKTPSLSVGSKTNKDEIKSVNQKRPCEKRKRCRASQPGSSSESDDDSLGDTLSSIGRHHLKKSAERKQRKISHLKKVPSLDSSEDEPKRLETTISSPSPLKNPKTRKPLTVIKDSDSESNSQSLLAGDPNGTIHSSGHNSASPNKSGSRLMKSQIEIETNKLFSSDSELEGYDIDSDVLKLLNSSQSQSELYSDANVVTKKPETVFQKLKPSPIAPKETLKSTALPPVTHEKESQSKYFQPTKLAKTETAFQKLKPAPIASTETLKSRPLTPVTHVKESKNKYFQPTKLAKTETEISLQKLKPAPIACTETLKSGPLTPVMHVKESQSKHIQSTKLAKTETAVQKLKPAPIAPTETLKSGSLTHTKESQSKHIPPTKPLAVGSDVDIEVSQHLDPKLCESLLNEEWEDQPIDNKAVKTKTTGNQHDQSNSSFSSIEGVYKSSSIHDNIVPDHSNGSEPEGSIHSPQGKAVPEEIGFSQGFSQCEDVLVLDESDDDDDIFGELTQCQIKVEPEDADIIDLDDWTDDFIKDIDESIQVKQEPVDDQGAGLMSEEDDVDLIKATELVESLSQQLMEEDPLAAEKQVDARPLEVDTGAVAKSDMGVSAASDKVVAESGTGVVAESDMGVVAKSDTGVDMGVVAKSDTGVEAKSDTRVEAKSDTGVVAKSDTTIIVASGIGSLQRQDPAANMTELSPNQVKTRKALLDMDSDSSSDLDLPPLSPTVKTDGHMAATSATSTKLGKQKGDNRHHSVHEIFSSDEDNTEGYEVPLQGKKDVNITALKDEEPLPSKVPHGGDIHPEPQVSEKHQSGNAVDCDFDEEEWEEEFTVEEFIPCELDFEKMSNSQVSKYLTEKYTIDSPDKHKLADTSKTEKKKIYETAAQKGTMESSTKNSMQSVYENKTSFESNHAKMTPAVKTPSPSHSKLSTKYNKRLSLPGADKKKTCSISLKPNDHDVSNTPDEQETSFEMEESRKLICTTSRSGIGSTASNKSISKSGSLQKSELFGKKRSTFMTLPPLENEEPTTTSTTDNPETSFEAEEPKKLSKFKFYGSKTSKHSKTTASATISSHEKVQKGHEDQVSALMSDKWLTVRRTGKTKDSHQSPDRVSAAIDKAKSALKSRKKTAGSVTRSPEEPEVPKAVPPRSGERFPSRHGALLADIEDETPIHKLSKKQRISHFTKPVDDKSLKDKNNSKAPKPSTSSASDNKGSKSKFETRTGIFDKMKQTRERNSSGRSAILIGDPLVDPSKKQKVSSGKVSDTKEKIKDIFSKKLTNGDSAGKLDIHTEKSKKKDVKDARSSSRSKDRSQKSDVHASRTKQKETERTNVSNEPKDKENSTKSSHVPKDSSLKKKSHGNLSKEGDRTRETKSKKDSKFKTKESKSESSNSKSNKASDPKELTSSFKLIKLTTDSDIESEMEVDQVPVVAQPSKDKTKKATDHAKSFKANVQTAISKIVEPSKTSNKSSTAKVAGSAAGPPTAGDIYTLLQLKSPEVKKAEAEVAAPVPKQKPQKVQTWTFDHVLLDMLKWSPNWWEEFEKVKQSPPVVNKAALVPLLETYNSYQDYLQIMMPHFIIETWHQAYRSWQESVQKKTITRHSLLPVFLDLNAVTDVKGLKQEKAFMDATCQGILSRFEASRCAHTQEGDFVRLHIKFRDQANQLQVKAVHGLVKKTIKIKKTSHIINKSLVEKLKNEPEGTMVLQVIIRMLYRKIRIVQNEMFEVEVVSNLTSNNRQCEALMVLNKNPLSRHILKPSDINVFSGPHHPVPPELAKKFNESQAKAINMISHGVLDAKQPKLYLLQGPPGTGKSHAITGLVQNIIAKSKEKRIRMRILLCAPSNAAVDELARRLKDINIPLKGKPGEMRFIRYGKASSMHRDVVEYSLDEQFNRKWREIHCKTKPMLSSVRSALEEIDNKLRGFTQAHTKFRQMGKTVEMRSLESEINKLEQKKAKISGTDNRRNLSPEDERKIRHELLVNCHVICSTLNGLGNARLMDDLSRPEQQINTCVIVDEAAQTIELDSLIPLQYGSTKLVLVGDPEQLPPTVISKEAQDQNYGQSLFERFYSYYKMRPDNPILMLTTQYRMHADICRFPNGHVYMGQLNTDPSVGEQRDREFSLAHYILFDLAYSKEKQEGQGAIYNEEEAVFIRHLCQYLLSQLRNLNPSKIGIITPYQRQRQAIYKELPRHLSQVEVGTVDGFQGREKDIIIISCVRAGGSTIGFLADRRRMNVALTRAKYACYVVGHVASLKMNSDWSALVEDAAKRRTMVHVSHTNAIKRSFDRLPKRR